MSRWLRKGLVLVCVVSSVSGFAQEAMNPADVAAAMAGVQAMLNDPAAFEKAASQTPEGTRAAQALNGVAGSEAQAAEMRALASSLFQSLVEDSQGDPAIMMQKIQAAQQNPEAFAESFTPEQRRRLREISSKVEQ